MQSEWLCFQDNISNTTVLFQCVLTIEPFPALFFFLFSHIFLLSHTFVDILFCLGQMYVSDRLSVLSCLLQLSHLLVSFSLIFHTSAGLCSVFLVFVKHLSVAY